MASEHKRPDDLDHQPNATDLFVGAKIRMRRMSLSISEAELATAAGVTPERVQSFEAGTERLGVPRLLQFSQLLGVPISWFFSGIGAEGEAKFGGKLPTPEATAAQARESEQTEQLRHTFGALSSSTHRRLVVELATALADNEARVTQMSSALAESEARAFQLASALAERNARSKPDKSEMN